ncbi:hypothetical protein V2J09_017057 [Rumex salicifolius]
MMKVVWIYIILAVVASSLTASGIEETPRTASRMLKAGAGGFGSGSGSVSHGKGKVGLDDYQTVDPSPSSKAVRPGPIQHGTPLIPYIPSRSPPPNPIPNPPMYGITYP